MFKKRKILIGLFIIHCLHYNSSFAKDKQVGLTKSSSPNIPNIVNVSTYRPYIQIGGAQSFGRINFSSTKIDFFLPVWQTPTKIVFADARAYYPGSGYEGNVHFGYRQLLPEEQKLYGIYSAFDRKKAASRVYFNQITFGVEHWNQSWFIGGNYYHPIGENTIINTEESKLLVEQKGLATNLWIVNTGGREKALSGADATVGKELTKVLTGYVCGYYFSADGVKPIYGPRVSLAYWSDNGGRRVFGIFDKVGLEVGAQYDTPRGVAFILDIKARIGLVSKSSSLDGVARHMIDPVRRDTDVVIGSSREKEVVSKKPATILVDGKPVELAAGGSPNIFSVATADEYISVLGNSGADIILLTKAINLDNLFSGVGEKIIAAGKKWVTSSISVLLGGVETHVGSLTNSDGKIIDTQQRVQGDIVYDPRVLKPIPNEGTKQNDVPVGDGKRDVIVKTKLSADETIKKDIFVETKANEETKRDSVAKTKASVYETIKPEARFAESYIRDGVKDVIVNGRLKDALIMLGDELTWSFAEEDIAEKISWYLANGSRFDALSSEEQKKLDTVLESLGVAKNACSGVWCNKYNYFSSYNAYDHEKIAGSPVAETKLSTSETTKKDTFVKLKFFAYDITKKDYAAEIKLSSDAVVESKFLVNETTKKDAAVKLKFLVDGVTKKDVVAITKLLADDGKTKLFPDEATKWDVVVKTKLSSDAVVNIKLPANQTTRKDIVVETKSSVDGISKKDINISTKQVDDNIEIRGSVKNLIAAGNLRGALTRLLDGDFNGRAEAAAAKSILEYIETRQPLESKIQAGTISKDEQKELDGILDSLGVVKNACSGALCDFNPLASFDAYSHKTIVGNPVVMPKLSSNDITKKDTTVSTKLSLDEATKRDAVVEPKFLADDVTKKDITIRAKTSPDEATKRGVVVGPRILANEITKKDTFVATKLFSNDDVVKKDATVRAKLSTDEVTKRDVLVKTKISPDVIVNKKIPANDISKRDVVVGTKYHINEKRDADVSVKQIPETIEIRKSIKDFIANGQLSEALNELSKDGYNGREEASAASKIQEYLDLVLDKRNYGNKEKLDSILKELKVNYNIKNCTICWSYDAYDYNKIK